MTGYSRQRHQGGLDLNKKIRTTRQNKIINGAFIEICKFLSAANIQLSELDIDKRHDSSVNEMEVKEIIFAFAETSPYFKKYCLKLLDTNKENNRDWFDFAIISAPWAKHRYFAPINIKVSDVEKGAADNLSCKMGIFYALTGCDPSDIEINGRKFNNNDSWETFSKMIDEYIGTNKKEDYYFLVVNKKDIKDIFYTSLKTLKSITANGNNLPFQCRWKDNRTRVERSYNEAKDFILSTLEESFRKRNSAKESFDKYVKKHFNSKNNLPKEDGLIIKTYERKWDAIWGLMFQRLGKSSPLQISFHQ